MGGGHAFMNRNPKQMAMCWPFLIMCLNCHQIITRQKAGGLKSELSGQVTVFFYNQDSSHNEANSGGLAEENENENIKKMENVQEKLIFLETRVLH